ncbi:polysaccharide biosynthesis tyrosine autokinase [uncultured Flavobacterium sp.]|uniref:exopolysaccharide transport family protein n=1 Tax=uncultured Flavobacterium sp. TaxID=165435 RepID=UPI0030C88264
MLDIKDFNILETQNSFDFKGFIAKLMSYWKWFILCLILTFTIAYQVNIRKEKIYGMETLIVVKDENNQLFSSNTSLVFNWGGTSDKVQTVITTLKSRSHNEIVVRNLQFYINYLKQTEYNLQDAYGETPFKVVIDENKGQIANQLLKIKFLNQNQFELSTTFENTIADLYHYADNTKSNVKVPVGDYKRTFNINEKVELPFLSFKLTQDLMNINNLKQEYFIKFSDFNSTVASYKSVDVEADVKGGSIIKIAKAGTNKARLVDFLNATVSTLKKRQLDSKNQFATNTIRFIDSTLIDVEKQMNEAEGELKSFRKDKNVYMLEGGGEVLTSKLSEYDVEKDIVNRKIAYYNLLKNYLEKNNDYSKLPAPTVAGIEDPNIISNVSKLIQLSTERSEKAYAVKNEKMFADFDVQMESVKKVLLNNIASSKSALQIDLSLLARNINNAESSIRQLPEQQQDLINFTRKFNLKDNIYTTFLEKRAEADIIRASNLSDIEFIDPAKDVGDGLIGPKTSVNYILALLLGLGIPFLIVFVITLLDNSINTTDDIEKLTKIPIIGVIGKNMEEGNLAVFDKPKSAIAESFRGIRSSLQFIYKKQKIEGAKIVMLTSSVGGEGKTFCTMNLATVFAMSGKRSVIVGLDLRKPKLFDEFNIDNNIGVVNYLIGQKKITEIVQNTHIPNLDIITSGPIPPNPAELIISDAMNELIEELKEIYDYIILDTPPVGLVSDALELAQYCDATLYIVRQAVTKKGMLSVVNEKHRRGELHNISIILNDFKKKSKYGYNYGYGYGSYEEGYVQSSSKKGFLNRFKKK